VFEILVDADACPVKDEIYTVAARYGLQVVLVANQSMRTPPGLGVEMVVVGRDPDAADDWIADEVHTADIVITADIPLAARCLKHGARVLGTTGRPFTEDSIGGQLATREIKSELREMGIAAGGPAALSSKDRSRFLSRLDEMCQASLRDYR
jgi:uncharacterized protein YaiI (UPF0178 family)